MVQESDGRRIESDRPRSRNWVWIGTAAVVVVVGLAATWLLGGSVDVEAATAEAERFYELFAADDIDGLKAMLDADTADIGMAAVDPPGEVERYTPSSAAAERDLVFWSAAGGEFRDRSCQSGETADGPVEVVCFAEFNDALRTAVGASWVETEATFEFSDGSIEAFELLFVLPADGTVPGFMDWLSEQHPRDFSIANLMPPLDDEDAIAAGNVRVQYADEYAAYLEENGCPVSGC